MIYSVIINPKGVCFLKNRIDKELFFDIQFSSRLLDTVSCPLHLHSCIEIIIVAEGTMHMLLGEQNYMINAGSAIYIEPYEAHKFLTIITTKAILLSSCWRAI